MADRNGREKLQWVTLFDKMKQKEKPGDDAIEIPDIDNIFGAGAGGDIEKGAEKSKSKKKLSVERIYQKKTQLEHILLRPDTYIGSVEKLTQNMWVWDEIEETFTQREITFVPGLYKIFDEILVNAADNKQRDKTMSVIKIDIDVEQNKIKIWNNGKGIPVVEHKVEKVYVPTLIFGTLLTSSNYNDDEKKVTGGRNGYGAKLCNIFSSRFIVETSSKEYHKSFKQEWTENMMKTTNAKLSNNKDEDFTCVTFYPDLSKFQMEGLDRDIVDLFTRRAYDIAAASRGVKVYLNGKKLPVKNFKDYVDMHVKGKVDDNNQPLKVVYENVNDRWEVAVTLSEKGFQQVSFVNSIATTKGGRHVDYVADQIVSKLIETVKKKQKKGESMNLKPFQVKSHLWVFVNAMIENPSFDSQTKENMTLQAKSFGSKCALTEKFINQANKVGIVESIMSWMKFKAQEKLNKKCGSTKHSKLKGIPKLDDANDAGTRNSLDCTLILTEGDSAKTLAVAGLSVVGRDRYGVFPLKGKVLNVREASHKQIMENAEINNIIKILGLRYKEKYDSVDSLKTLRYGKLMIMTDQDQDGSHIKGLLVNFIHHNWPGLLKQRFLEEFITPIVKVTKGNQQKSFYSLPEFEEWKNETDNWHTYRVKYYKGLGTSTAKEAKEYFSDMNRHRIFFQYSGTQDDLAINLAFSKKKIEERKEWLTSWMEERKRRAQLDLPEIYLYGKQTASITYNEFVNRELILFSNMDNERSLPSLVDGFKPGQRKVMFTCFKRNITKEIKVAQLAGSVGEHSAYHHGEASLMGTIICLAQNYVGSNNINVLQPIGQFGTRLHGGKDSASPRYIFTALSPLARLIFPANDDALLKHMYDDNQKIEPEWYIPILPMVLVNGAEGIGTGWSTRIHNHNPEEIVANIRRMLNGEEPTQMLPWFKNFTGSIEPLEEQKFVCNGEVSVIDESTIEISELPVRTWTQAYKENVLEPMLQGTEKTPPMILDYKEYHTDTTVKFVVKMTPDKLNRVEAEGLHKVFKLQNSMSSASMVLYDHTGCIKRYTDSTQILKDFYELRLDFYDKRKKYLEGMLAAESLKLNNQARFIMEKIEGVIVVENKTDKEMLQILQRRGFDPDPVKAWREKQNEKVEDDLSQEEEEDPLLQDFDYLLDMAIKSLTMKKKEELLRKNQVKEDELRDLKRKSPSDLWKIDLDAFMAELKKLEQKERESEQESMTVPSKTAKGRKTVKKVALEMTRPSPVGRRVEPKIDAIKAKAAKAEVARKRAKVAKVKSSTIFEDDDEDSREPMSLSERVGGLKSSEEKKPKSPTKVKPKKEPKEPKEPTEKKKGSPKKKGKKRDPWSEESEVEEMSDLSDSGSLDMIIPREKTSRRAAASKVKYNFEESGSEEECIEVAGIAASNDHQVLQQNGEDSDSDGSDFDFATKKAEKPTVNVVESVFGKSSEEIFSEPTVKPKTKESKSEKTVKPKTKDSKSETTVKPKAKDSKPAATKKRTLGKKPSKDDGPKVKKPKKKKMIDSDSEDDDDFDMHEKMDFEQEEARARPGRKAAAVKYTFEDDEEDEDDWE